jgi:glycosyltransferase involved in cell wall biosynthesis
VKCRILYLVGQLGTGGLERQLYLLLQSMDRDRYRPEVVIWRFREDERYVEPLRALKIPLHSFPPSYSKLAKLRAFRNLVLALQPEIVHSYSFYTNFAVQCATFGTKSRAVGAVRSNFTNDKRSCGLLLGSLSARWPQLQVYNNMVGAEKAKCSHSLFAPRQICVVRNGIDLTQFPKVPVPENATARIVGIGSLLEIKRWDRLLRAAAILKTKGLDFQMEIFGDGPLRESLKRQANELGISDRAGLRGYTDNIPDVLAGATFLAHTSDIEGCPNVVMEAMACGRPVVAMDAGDIPFLVDDGQTGFVVPVGDDDNFVRRLLTLINNHSLCQKMGEAGRIKAEREFGMDRLIVDTFDTYRAAGWKDLLI